MQGYRAIVALIPDPDPMNIHAFLEPLVKEFKMYGPLEPGDDESSDDYIKRVKETKRDHVARVTRAVPMKGRSARPEGGHTEDEEEEEGRDEEGRGGGLGRPAAASRREGVGDTEDDDDDEDGGVVIPEPNEWAGASRPPLSKKRVVLDENGDKFLVYEADTILFLGPITCDMPQRDATMNRGGTARIIGCGWCLFPVRHIIIAYIAHISHISRIYICPPNTPPRLATFRYGFTKTR